MSTYQVATTITAKIKSIRNQKKMGEADHGSEFFLCSGRSMSSTMPAPPTFALVLIEKATLVHEDVKSVGTVYLPSSIEGTS